MLIGLKVKTELPVIMLFFRLDAYFRSDKQINLVIYLHYLSLIRNFETASRNYFRSDKQTNLVIYLHYLSLIRNFDLRSKLLPLG